jgi:hypothetical protein
MDAIKPIKHNVVPNLLLLFVVLYMGQGALYPIGSTVSKISLIAFVVATIILIITSIKKSDLKIDLFRYTLFFTLLNILYYSFSLMNEYDDLKFSFFRSILYTLLSFFAGYYLSLTFRLKPNKLKWLFITLLIFAILNFFRQGDLIEDTNTLQNNGVYGVVMLFPFLFLIKNRLISLALMSIMYIVVIWSFKRGGIITGSILLLVYMHYLIFNSAEYSSFAAKLLKRFFILILVIFIANYFIGEILSNEIIVQRFQNIEEDRGSKREYIFQEIFFGWLNFDKPFNFLFGYGFLGSTLFAIGLTAHNDFLEVVSNFGLFGMIILMGIWYSLFKIIRNKSFDTVSKYITSSVLLAWLIDSQFQQFYNSLYSFSMMLILGFVVGKEKYTLLNAYRQ